MVNIKELTGRNLSQSNRMLVKNAYDRGVEFKKLKNGKFKMSCIQQNNDDDLSPENPGI